jgi:hypothetical protein
MVSGFKLVAWIVLVTGLLVLCTRYAPGDKMVSESRLAGYPLVAIASEDARGVIAIGQTAYGVVVLAQGGGGLITFAQGGVGILFGLGQGMVGLIAICQIGVGLLFIMAQIGGGVFCLGQAVIGYAGAGQGAAVKRGIEVLKELDEEVGELLARPRLRRSTSAGQ